MIAQVRAARPAVILNGQDYYTQLAPYLISVEYTDNCDGEKADDLQIELADRDKRFISDWMPDKGVYLDVSIVAERWFALNAAPISLDCGRFWIDEISFELPANTCSIKGSSIPTNTRIKGSDETRGWEGSSLHTIAEQIAGENQMTVDYQSSVNPRYKRVEQDDESGLAFLKKQANNAKLSIKVHRNKLVIFDEEAYEAAPAKFTIVYGNAASPGDGLPTYRMAGGSFANKMTDTTKAAKVTHSNPETGRTTDELYKAGESDLPDEAQENVNEDPGDEPDETQGEDGGHFLMEPRSGDTLDDIKLDDPSYNSGKGAGRSSAAQRKAKSVVRDANKDKLTGNIDLAIGNPLIAAGMTFNLVGVGKFDGKWFVTSAKHKVGPMFTTSLDMRRCLEGY